MPKGQVVTEAQAATTTTVFDPEVSCPLNGTYVTMHFGDCLRARGAVTGVGAAASGTGTTYSATCLVSAPHYSNAGVWAPQYTIEVTNTSQSPLTVSGFRVAFFDSTGARVGSDVESPGQVQVEAITPEQQQQWFIQLNALQFPGDGVENNWRCTVLSVDTGSSAPAQQCPTEADIIAVTPAANQQDEQLLGRMATQGEIYDIAKRHCQSRLGQ